MSIDRVMRNRRVEAPFVGHPTEERAPRGRLRVAPHDVGVPPLAASVPARDARTASAKRVALVRGERGDGASVALLREFATAARARIEWSERSTGVAASLARALADSDAVVAERLPCLRQGERTLLPRFHSVVRAPSAFGSAAEPRSVRRADLLVFGAVGCSAAAWERSVQLAAAWARAEGRRSLDCAVRDPGWPILASDRAIRVRRIAGAHPELRARRVSHEGARRRLLFESQAFDAIVADGPDVDALVRAACAAVGWSNRVPSLYLGEERSLVVLGDAAGASHGVESGESAFAIARAAERMLRHLGETGAAERLGAALAAELAARQEASGDLWLDLASETPERFGAAIAVRLGAAARH